MMMSAMFSSMRESPALFQPFATPKIQDGQGEESNRYKNEDRISHRTLHSNARSLPLRK